MFKGNIRKYFVLLVTLSMLLTSISTGSTAYANNSIDEVDQLITAEDLSDENVLLPENVEAKSGIDGCDSASYDMKNSEDEKILIENEHEENQASVFSDSAKESRATSTRQVAYVDEAGTEQTVNATVITSYMGILDEGWYVVSSDVERTGTVIVSGDVKLILADGNVFTVTENNINAGIQVTEYNNKLTIYGQIAGTGVLNTTGSALGAGIGGSYGNSNAGDIVINGGVVEATGGHQSAGIGGGYGSSTGGNGGNIKINGGVVKAIGAAQAAGIGGGSGNNTGGNGGNITISGGTIHATGGNYAAGIGGSNEGGGGNITISGGTVKAIGASQGAGIGGGREGSSGTIKINSGTVNATGGYAAAGVGGGSSFDGGGDGGNITINGGNVEATGGEYGAGIGVGYGGNGGMITINDGTVNAAGGEQAPGIGGAIRGGNAGVIVIRGGTVDTTGGYWGAGIGAGYNGSGEKITIEGGIVNAVGGNQGAGIGGGSGNDYGGNSGHITISGGTVEAVGGDFSAGIGGGYCGDGNTVSITEGKVKATGGLFGAGIGGGFGYDIGGNGGEISIVGGEVETVGGQDAAGIGGGKGNKAGGNGGDISINEGILKATGGDKAAGIGGGFGNTTGGAGGNIIIGGGDVIAKGGYRAAGIGGSSNGDGGNIVISSGVVDARGGDWGAGIGGGSGLQAGGRSGDILIEGGTVEATGGEFSAGIGGGMWGNGNNITIRGGIVKVKGGDQGAGIGSGSGSDSGTSGGNIVISGGAIEAKGGNLSAGIGGGYHGSGKKITISGGTVKAIGASQGAGIGGGSGNYTGGNGGEIIVSGGTIEATGGNFSAGIGGGYNGNGGIVILSGGLVFAEGDTLFKDIGGGCNSNSDGYLNIIKSASLFLRNNSSVYPNTSTHINPNINGHTAGDEVFGISVHWNGDFGAWLRIFNNKISFDSFGGNDVDPIIQDYGTEIIAPDEPSRAGYTFSGWNPALPETMPVGGIEVVALWTAIDYSVVFKDWDGSILSSDTYHYGDSVVIPENPIREADNTYTYTFSAWDNEVVDVVGDATYTATYTPEYIDYSVVFKDWDESILSSDTYHYGDSVVIPENPIREADNTYTYTFSAWDNEVVDVVGDATYTATYTPEYIDYSVVFKDWDGSILSSDTYHYGDSVVIPEDPIREADNTYTYTFSAWDNEVVDVVGDVTYTATYTPEYIDYSVVFKDWDGSILSSDTYHYGDSVVIPENPIREADNTYTYTFSAWDNEVVDVVGDATYTATYTPEYIDYSVVFKDWDESILSSDTYHYGDSVVIPENPERDGYYLAGWYRDKVFTEAWDFASDQVIENLILYAKWSPETANAMSELETYVDSADYTESAAALTEAISAGKEAIEAATTLEEVATALSDAKAAIDLIKTDAELAADRLDQTKADAKDELDSYVDSDYYTENASALAAAISTGKETIETATTLEEVATALSDAKAAIDLIKTDAELAADRLDQTKADAKDELDSYVDSDYYTENASALAAAISTGKETIETATTLEEVATALSDAKAAIDLIKTDAELAKSVEILLLPTKLHYLAGEALDLRGGKMLFTSADSGDGSHVTMADPLVSVSGFDSNSEIYGPKTITVEYGGATTSFTVYLNRFSDVPYGYDFYPTIMDLAGKGIVAGYSDGRYGINDNITRAQAAVMLVRALGLETEGLQSNFTDVPNNYWAAAQIAAAAKAKIVNGYGDGRFGPDAKITRAELSVMVARAFDIKVNPNKTVSFTDVPTGFWAEDYIKALASNGVVSGYRDGRFGVKDNATRAQFSKFLSYSLNLAK